MEKGQPNKEKGHDTSNRILSPEFVLNLHISFRKSMMLYCKTNFFAVFKFRDISPVFNVPNDVNSKGLLHVFPPTQQVCWTWPQLHVFDNDDNVFSIEVHRDKGNSVV